MVGIHRARSMSDQVAAPAAAEPALPEWTVRDLVARYPETMTVLGPLGIDLCCGGAHPLGEALDLHGLEREPVLVQIANIVEASRERAH